MHSDVPVSEGMLGRPLSPKAFNISTFLACQ